MNVMGDIARLGAKRYPDSPAVILGGDRLSYQDLEWRANALAQRLAGLGVAPGDRCALLAENCLEYPVAVFAVLKLGAVLVPLNFRYRASEVAYVVNDAAPSVLLHGAGYLDLAIEASLSVKHAVALVSLVDLVDEAARHGAAACPAVEVDPDAAAMVMYTSGTTGFPKGVLFSHRAYLSSIVGIALSGELSRVDRVLVNLPLFHNGGLNALLMPALAFGACTVVSPAGFRPESVLACVEQERITLTMWVPTMLSMLVNSPQLQRFNLRTLQRIWYGSSPIAPNLLATVRRCFPGVGLVQFYGMTETGMTSVLGPQDHEQRSQCTGREMFNAELRIVDEQLRDVGAGAIGELLSRQSPLGMIGYLNNEKASRETIVDGWIRTGDVARYEGDGFFTIVDRKKEMIISGAENIYPQEIENLIASHPDVLEVAVFGIPDPVYGESVSAAVVRRPGASVSSEDLRAWCAQRVASYKKPKQVEFMNELPKNAAGKVTKHVLREPYWRGYNRSV